jgi:hypothetical protein
MLRTARLALLLYAAAAFADTSRGALALVSFLEVDKLCGRQPTAWHSTRSRPESPASVLLVNVAKRLCALQQGRLGRPARVLSIAPDQPWPHTALLLTTALAEAYTTDRQLILDAQAQLPQFWVPSGQSECPSRAPWRCLFSSPLLAGPAPQGVQVVRAEWSQAALAEHYLRGATLPWLRSRTVQQTGCSLAAAFLSAVLQPSSALVDALVPFLHAANATTGAAARLVLLHGDAVESTLRDAAAALGAGGEVGTGQAWMLGGSDAALDQVRMALPSMAVHRLAPPPDASPEVTEALHTLALAHATAYVGPLDAAWVKAGLLLAMARYGSFPRVISGESRWKDMLGFASCTAEEFRMEMRAQAGALWLCASVSRPLLQ